MRIRARVDGIDGLSALDATDPRTDFKINIEADCNFAVLSFEDFPPSLIQPVIGGASEIEDFDLTATYPVTQDCNDQQVTTTCELSSEPMLPASVNAAVTSAGIVTVSAASDAAVGTYEMTLTCSYMIDGELGDSVTLRFDVRTREEVCAGATISGDNTV